MQGYAEQAVLVQDGMVFHEVCCVQYRLTRPCAVCEAGMCVRSAHGIYEVCEKAWRMLWTQVSSVMSASRWPV